MYQILTCNGYRTETVATTMAEAVRLCAEHEELTNDGWARVVTMDGQIVADRDGEYEEDGPYEDAASLTGMYDH